jgi:hypothetical protein
MAPHWLRRGRHLASVLATAFAMLAPSALYADDKAMEKYRDWLPSQILELPEEKRLSEVPIAYIRSAKTVDLTIQSFLNALMYDGLADFEGAKRRFQGDLGDPQTGALTVGQITELSNRAGRTQLTRVSFFPFNFGGSIYSEYARVRGTATIFDENIAYPINFVEIECEKREGICKYRQISLIIPEKMSWSNSYTVMETRNEQYKITHWDDHRIDAAPLIQGKCRIPELRLNFSNKEFYEIVTNAPEGKCELELGGSLPRLDKPRISQIVDGAPVIREVFSKLNTEVYEYLSSDYRKQVEIAFPLQKSGNEAGHPQQP